MISDIIITQMKTEDEISGKAYVHYKAWHETYSGLIDSDYMKTVTLEKCNNIAHRWLDNIMVAKNSDRVIGFIGYGAYRDTTLPDYGEIYAIYVLEEYHHKKVGYALMNEAFNKLSGFKKIAVWVLKGNEKAIRFYKKYGFHFDGVEQEIMLGTANMESRMIYERG